MYQSHVHFFVFVFFFVAVISTNLFGLPLEIEFRCTYTVTCHICEENNILNHMNVKTIEVAFKRHVCSTQVFFAVIMLAFCSPVWLTNKLGLPRKLRQTHQLNQGWATTNKTSTVGLYGILRDIIIITGLCPIALSGKCI